MNNEIREMLVEKYRKERAALVAIQTVCKDTMKYMYTKENIISTSEENVRVTELLNNPAELFAMVIDTATSEPNPDFKCDHKIVYQHYGEDRYKCLDCDARLYIPHKRKLCDKTVLSYKMMNKRPEYLTYLLEMPSDEAVAELLKRS